MTSPPAATESAVVVPVPEAEPAVGRHRARLDSAAGLGVPAHVTVLFPFVAPPDLTSTTMRQLAAAIGSVAEFGCVFRRTAWFNERVLWLAPEPDAPFRALIRAVTAAFPDYPPYGGAHSDVVPHLTIGENPAANSRGEPTGSGPLATGNAGPLAVGGADQVRVAELRAAESDVRRALPVPARISRAWLMTGSAAAGSWRRVADLPLGPPA
jgi:2'-5' RNA ligase